MSLDSRNCMYLRYIHGSSIRSVGHTSDVRRPRVRPTTVDDVERRRATSSSWGIV